MKKLVICFMGALTFAMALVGVQSYVDQGPMDIILAGEMKKEIIMHWLHQEEVRQKIGINLIASENYAPQEVMAMVGSALMNKYVEGYAGARYYSGCEFIDKIEEEAIARFKRLFKAEHVNVQPHSGSQANFAVYFALLKPGDTILSMKLSDGGHLTHGHKVNMSGALYNVVSYGVDSISEQIDYQALELLAYKHKPKLIVAGASSYSRIIDFERIAQIAQSVEAYFLADIAHIAGLVAVGLHPSPVGVADVVTMTTHKTFRGPRGGVILCKQKLASSIDRAVMPGIQGGAFAHEIAAKGVACALAEQSDFYEYQKRVLENAKIMSQLFKDYGYKVVAQGTDNHLFLVDVRPLGMSGKDAEKMLESVGIFVNRNVIPFDSLSPLQAGGIRIGTPAITTRGATMQDCKEIVDIIHVILQQPSKFDRAQIVSRVHEITSRWS